MKKLPRKSKQFDKLHLELMLQSWKKELNLSLTQYKELLKEIGEHELVKTIEEGDMRLGSCFLNIPSFYTDHINWEKRDDDRYVRYIALSSHLGEVLRGRRIRSEYKILPPHKLFDPLIGYIHEIESIFTMAMKSFQRRHIPGEEFMAFLEKHRISPYIWFWLIANDEHGSSSTLSLKPDHFSFCFKIEVDRIEDIQLYVRIKDPVKASLITVTYRNIH